MKQRKKILTVRGNADPSRVKYTQDTLHTQLPIQFQQVLELYRILRVQLEQLQIQSSPSNQ